MKKLSFLLILAMACNFYAPVNAMKGSDQENVRQGPTTKKPAPKIPGKIDRESVKHLEKIKEPVKKIAPKIPEKIKREKIKENEVRLTDEQEEKLIAKIDDENVSNQECIKLIHELKISPNYEFIAYNTDIVNYTTSRCRTSLLQELIKNGADVNIKENFSDSPLHNAVYAFYYSKEGKIINKKNAFNCIKILVNNNANLFSTNEKGQIPRYIIKYEGGDNLEAYEYLKAKETEQAAIMKEKQAKIRNEQAKIIRENGYTTGYKDGNVTKTLDLCIFLDDKDDKIEIILGDKFDPIANDFAGAIEAEEAIVVSKFLLKYFYKVAMSSKVGAYRYRQIINKLLCTNNWSIFREKNHDLFVLIPHSKYQEIKKIEDLSTIGLNPKTLNKELDYSEKILLSEEYVSINAQNKFESLIKESGVYTVLTTYGKLESIFLKKRILNLRIFLTGHGTEKTSAYKDKNDLIAQLSNEEYRKLRDLLNDIGCSFLYVDTCFGGEQIFMNQTLNLQRTKPETSGPLSSKNFIEVAIGIPSSTTEGPLIKYSEYSQFFININNFFENQKKSIIELIKSKQKLNEKEINYLSKNITEQQILSGGKIQLLGKTTSFDLPPILKRKSGIKTSADFVKILKNFIFRRASNIPRVRFPGDAEMAPLKEVFPNLVKDAKKELNKILDEKKKDLEKDEKMLPGFIAKKHAGTELLKQTIDRLKIEIYDIGEYLKQLDRK